MHAQLNVNVVVVAPDRRVLEGAVHPLDLTMRPGTARLGQAVLNVVASAGRFEAAGAERLASGVRLLDERRGRGDVAGRGEMRAVHLDLKQPTDAVALPTAMQRGSGQVGSGGSEGVKAGVAWQQRVSLVRRRQPPPRRLTARSSAGPSDQYADRQPSCAASTGRRFSDRYRSAWPASSGSLDDAGSRDGLPPSWWRSHGELGLSRFLPRRRGDCAIKPWDQTSSD